MLNYNQKYKDQLIATITDNSGNIFDASLTSDTYFSAVGQKTTSALTSISQASKVGLWVTKPDSVFNLANAGSVGIYDDNGNLYGVDISSVLNKYWTGFNSDSGNNFYFDKTDKNVRVDFTGDSTNLTTPMSTLRSVVTVADFTVINTLPSDVKCNYNNGVHQYIPGQSVNLLFEGGLRKGDTITIKRNARPDHTSTLNFDTDLAFINLSMDGNTVLQLIYKHNSPDPVPVTPTPTKEYELFPTLQNASIVDPKPVNSHYYLDSSHTTVTIKANTGCTFESDGSLTYQQSALNQGTIAIKATHTDTSTVSLPSNIDWSIQQEFMLTLGAVNSKIVTSTGGFTNIYKADYDNLLKISNEVIAKMSSDDVSAYEIKPYFDNLIMLPFNVPSGENSAVVAGNETFKTQLPTVDNNYLTVDLGKITVPEQYKNGFDYYQVKTRLMLPYTSMVDIDPIHVINKTVAIKYVIDVITGDTTINLYNDDLFYSEQVNLANKVPFISNDTNGSQAVVINQLKTMFRNDIQQAYIIIEQPTPILNSDYYPTNEKGTLQGYNGNVKASLLNNVNINPDDLNALQNILESGVNIK